MSERTKKLVVVGVLVLCIVLIWCIKNDVFESDSMTYDNGSVVSGSTDILLEDVVGMFGGFSEVVEGDILDEVVDVETQVEDIDLSLYELDVKSLDMFTWLSAGVPVVIDLGSDSCIPCMKMYPVLELVNAEMQGKALIKFLDVWKYPMDLVGLNISMIPTQLFFNSSGEAYSVTGEESVDLVEVYADTGEHLYTYHVGALEYAQFYEMLVNMGVS